MFFTEFLSPVLILLLLISFTQGGSCPHAPPDKRSESLSHNTGVINPVSFSVGPDTGVGQQGATNEWTVEIPSTPETDTKFIMIHFSSFSLPGSNRIEIDLGYTTEVITASTIAPYWTRPINIYPLSGAPIVVRYIADSVPGSGIGNIDQVGVGVRLVGDPGHDSFSNCDPFFTEASYLVPDFDDFWYCTDPPNWENVACIPSATDVRAEAARSVGMILTPHADELSTCSVTLIDNQQVILAGHCLDFDEEGVGSSVIFNYETACNNDRLPGYAPFFYKVRRVLERVWSGGIDYARLELEEQPAGVPVLQMRPDIPAPGEEVFGVHHPNGAVKVMSVPHGQGFSSVVGSANNFISVPTDFHVSGGSSGSALFDTAGRVVGVLSRGNPCSSGNLLYYPSASILGAISDPPGDPDPARDVMLVLDRSGSMSQNDISSRSKMDAAKDAASLFVQLIREDIGNRIGLVSFSTSASVEASLADADAGTKLNLIGNAPYTAGEVGSLTPSGQTAIGDALAEARDELPQGGNPRAILLMTDGMENVSPFIEDVEPTLGDITVHGVGFGTDSTLDSNKLTDLTSNHAGLFSRATSGLSLQKFFSQAFGNIFEMGVLQDPDELLSQGQYESRFMNFSVCDEDYVTVVVGWEDERDRLMIKLLTPSGTTVDETDASVEVSTGRTWTFLRVKLPYDSQRSGTWKVGVYREKTRQAKLHSLRYFVNVIPTGGPTLKVDLETRRYYTGESVNPRVVFRFGDGSWPLEADVSGTLRRPIGSVGDILSKVGLKDESKVEGDVIPARQETLQKGGYHIGDQSHSFVMTEESVDTSGTFEKSGMYGTVLTDQLKYEGVYDFHVRARTMGKCVYTREVMWSIPVDPGIDSGRTIVATSFTGRLRDGRLGGVMIVDPRDMYGHRVGPGRLDLMQVSGAKGTALVGGVVDLLNGKYEIEFSCDLEVQEVPAVVLRLPGRDTDVMLMGTDKCEV